MTRTKPDTLGDRLRVARIAAGYEQTDLADALGVHRSLISAAEHGRRGIKADNLILWAQLCDVSLDWLAWGTEGAGRKFGPTQRAAA